MSGKKGSSARRVLKVLKMLKGHNRNGLSNKEIAEALGETPVNVSRALAVLEDEGLVVKLESGRWGHSVLMIQIAQAFANDMAAAQERIHEINRRVLAGAAPH